MYVYAFLKTPTQTIELPMGIEGTATLVVCGPLAALTEPNLSLDELQRSDERLMRAVLDHDRVLQDLFHYATILPLRFGTFFRSMENLMTHVEKHQYQYCSRLDQLEGKAEYLVKLWPKPYVEKEGKSTHTSPKTGRSYFLAKKQRYHAQSQYQHQQQDEFEQILTLFQAQPFEVVQGKGNDDVERLYLLSDRSLNLTITENLPHQLAHFSTWQVQIGPPLPPYHFVD